MKNKQVKFGAILSYSLIIINALYNLLITPYVIGCLGDIEYGVYKSISSLTASLMILDLGIGGTVLRYVAKYRTTGQHDEIPNFISMNLVQAAFLSVLISIFCFCFYSLIPIIYSETFNESEVIIANRLFIVLSINMIIHVFENVLNGAISGYNCFIFSNGVKLFRILLRVLLVLVTLSFLKSSFALVLIDLVLTIIVLIAEVIYLKFKLNVKVRLVRWDKSVFKESGKYTLMMFLTSLAVQINSNLDNVFIGSLKGPTLVTTYSIGLLFFTTFENLSTSISSVMLPTVTATLSSENPDENIKKIVISAGRIQFILLGAAIIGFIFLGKDFISLWMGSEYTDAYIIALILMIPSLFELCINVCLSILRAKNILQFRTIILSVFTILNAIITFLTVKYWSYFGAAIGTAFSFIVGSVIIMNIYYSKKLKLPMLRIYLSIFDRIWICLLISGIAIFISSRFLNGSWLEFLANVIVFFIVYLLSLMFYGLRKDEKRELFFRNNK